MSCTCVCIYIHIHTQIKQKVDDSLANIVHATFYPSTTSLEQPTCPLSDPAVGLWVLPQFLKTGILKCQFNFSAVIDRHAQSPRLAVEAGIRRHTSQFWFDSTPFTLSQPRLSISPPRSFKLTFWMFSEICFSVVNNPASCHPGLV